MQTYTMRDISLKTNHTGMAGGYRYGQMDLNMKARGLQIKPMGKVG